MNIEEYRDYCLSLSSHVTESFPFDDKILVFKIGGKMFALADVTEFISINLKCDPERAIELREQFPGIVPGYHMSKVHWNTVSTDGSVSDKMIRELIQESFDLIVKSLPKKAKAELGVG
ncbi:MAG: MmcQ/YjbR family DNA-binding protein [Flavobacteriales bacterium]|nr:MmcQ/YjbR family DNA-binding protein [Flavobacteriales bacterium]